MKMIMLMMPRKEARLKDMRIVKTWDGKQHRHAWVYDDDDNHTWFHSWATGWYVGVLQRRLFICITLAIWFGVLAFLTGCQSIPATPPVLINGFDPTLTSHAEALGLKEPRKP